MPTTSLSTALFLSVSVFFAVPSLASAQAPDTAAAVQALTEFQEACSAAEGLWPAELCGPVVLVDPATRLAVANAPDRAGEFQPHAGMYVGSWPTGMGVANTALEWDGTMWAMAMLPLTEDRFSRLRLLAHESFHRIQPELGLEIADPMASHLDEEEGRVWLRLEIRALAHALRHEGDAAREAARDALLFRQVRYDHFPDAAPVERQLEAHEGLAEYTGVRFALDVTGEALERVARSVDGFQNRPTYVRSLGYGTGPALGLLLDRYDPDWRRELGAEPDLARRLAQALDAPEADPEAEPLQGLATRRAAAYGAAEVQAQEGERAEELRLQRAQYRVELVDGPVLALELPERRLMFNPNTVVSMGPDGNVYPGAILEGPWGRLTLQEGATLATPDRDRAWVAAPQALEPDDQGIVHGPGWTLALEPDWCLVPDPASGNVRLERAGTPLNPGQDREIEGQVVDIDATPMFLDGDGEIFLRTELHGRVLVRVPARERLCAAQGLELFHLLESGDSVRVRGRVSGSQELLVCVEETHFLERLDET